MAVQPAKSAAAKSAAKPASKSAAKPASKSAAKPASKTRAAAPIRFDATIGTANGRAILRLPDTASKELPSRGQVAARGTLDGRAFETVIEPDGDFGHWIKLDGLRHAAALKPGHAVTVLVEPTQEWPEPSVPDDLARALASAPAKVRDLWAKITPMARWEWVRWVNETKNPDTRKRRVEVGLSKLGSGKRRPCCFNLASCTDPDVAKSGKLAAD